MGRQEVGTRYPEMEARSYPLDKPLPSLFGNLIRPPIIQAPDIRSRYVNAWLNGNNLWNILLEDGMLRNVHKELNLYIFCKDIFVMMSGKFTVMCNVTQDSEVIDWGELVDSTKLAILNSRVATAENEEMYFREKAEERPDEAYADLRAIKKAGYHGELAHRIAGKHLAAMSKGNSQKKEMTPRIGEIFDDDDDEETQEE